MSDSPARTRRAFVLAAAAVAVMVGVSAAAPGDLDPSFGGDGIVMTRFGDDNAAAAALVVQADGKLAAAGYTRKGYSNSDFVLARYNADGTLDTSFGRDGKVRIRTETYDGAAALVVQADGKLVAAGATLGGSGYEFQFVRFNVDGALDTSFDGDGIVTTQVGNEGYAHALVLQPDGKVVGAGGGEKETRDFGLVRLHPDGRLDTSFSRDGKVRTDVFGHDGANALVVQDDRKLVAAGGSDAGLALVRYKPDGRLDRSFGGDGKVTLDVTNSVNALSVQADGKLVAGGAVWTGSDWDFLLVRFNPDGSLDSSFGDGGIVTTPIGRYDDVRALVVQDDGKIVAAGKSADDSGTDFTLARYSADGTLDASFGDGGIVRTAVSTGADYAYALALQEDGKIVAAGTGWNASRYTDEFVLARYDG